MTNTHPHRIEPIIKDERRRSRNCLRVDYISDGIEPRCNLRPRDEQGEWVLKHRPNHLREMIQCFDYCINDEGCENCRIYFKAMQKHTPPFIRVDIRVVQLKHQHHAVHPLHPDDRIAVLTLGSCSWYDLYIGRDINAAAEWVKRHGGALGGHQQDDADPTSINYHGRYRQGFVNGYLIPEGLQPPYIPLTPVL